MKDTYYVRRGVANEILSTRLSTPSKQYALQNAADNAIMHPGYFYAVYRDKEEIAKFFVKGEE